MASINDPSDLEKSTSRTTPEPSAQVQAPRGSKGEKFAGDDRYHFDERDLDRVQRRLGQRHVQMIGIAGAIGTGIFLSSGYTLSSAGPLGALIAYSLVGSVAYAMINAVAEMTTWAPISGTFPHYAGRWVDPALGFTLGWNYFYGTAISIPAEVTATVIILTYWDANEAHAPIYTAVILFGMCAINFLGVRYFGESEFVFAIMKITLIVGLILAGLIVSLGGGPNHDRIGFRYWKDPGALNRAGYVDNIHSDRFIALLSVIVSAAFSFLGIETVCIAASETLSPRRNIATAVRRVFYRILLFYVFSILIIGMLVAYNDEALLSSTGTAAQSPFVIAFERAGVQVFPHIINAGIFASAFSAGNSYVFCASRVLYGLSLRGHAPRFLSKCTKSGLPIMAIVVSSAFSLLSFMNVKSGSVKVFSWFVNLTTTGGFVGWFLINLTYIRFYQGMKAQGIDRRSNTFSHPWQPYLSYWGAGWSLFFIVFTGLPVFFNFTAVDFIISYINVFIVLALYLSYKIAKKTKIWRVDEMDFFTGIPTKEETELPEEPPRNIFERVAKVIF